MNVSEIPKTLEKEDDINKNLHMHLTVACFLSSRTDLLCSPRIAAGEAMCLVMHLVSYRGRKNCT